MSGSRSKNFRRRSETYDLNYDDKATAPAASTQTQATAPPLKPKNRKPEGPTRLSFADDEEDEEGTTAIKPIAASRPTPSSSRSTPLHKITSAKDRAATVSTPKPSNVQPQAGEYTKERLRELQKNARPLGAAPKPPPSLLSSSAEPTKAHKPDLPTEPVIVLKGLVKPAPPAIPGREKEKEVKDEEEEVEELEDKSDDEKLQFGKLGISRKDSSVIPDQATINAIRAKRERLRQLRGPAPDYISLDSDGVLASRTSASGSSDEEDNDLRGRIALFADKKDGGPKKGVFEDIDERVMVTETRVVDGGYREMNEDDEDEEDRKWEEEQVRKGLGKRIDEASTHVGASGVPPGAPVQPQPSIFSTAVHQSQSKSVPLVPSIGVSRSAQVLSISQQAEVATRALHENITKLKETNNRTMMSLLRTDENLSESLSDITTLEKSLEAAGEKFVFMQQLRDFISVMCDFLQDKAPFIEELEEQMQKLHEERASVVMERRSADIGDELSEVEAAVSAAMAVLNKGSTPSLVSAATTAAQAASAAVRESSNLPVQLDEFGRDVNLQKRMDLARRTEARKRRKARSESKRMSHIEKDQSYQRIEGESSTDESDSDSSAYKSCRDELLQTAAQIFSDAADEYSKLSVVKERLERWKRLYPLSYRDAYMSLSAATIFSPYVRLELLKWDPLYHKTDFNDMEWHDLLFDYGLPAKDHDFDPNDADGNLIPELVEKVALPILHHEIAHCWDMLSTERTENAVFATSLVINYIPASSEALQELLAVVRTCLGEAIMSLNVPTWSTVIINAVPGAAQLAAYRFGRSIRLLRNICMWKDILALPVLEKLALEELLGKKLLPHIRSIFPNIHDAITRTERIVASLSGVWHGSTVTADHSQKLQPLVECVGKLGRKLEERRGRASEEETLGLARRLKKMLVELNEYDKAREILRRFQLKEAL